MYHHLSSSTFTSHHLSSSIIIHHHPSSTHLKLPKWNCSDMLWLSLPVTPEILQKRVGTESVYKKIIQGRCNFSKLRSLWSRSWHVLGFCHQSHHPTAWQDQRRLVQFRLTAHSLLWVPESNKTKSFCHSPCLSFLTKTDFYCEAYKKMVFEHTYIYMCVFSSIV